MVQTGDSQAIMNAQLVGHVVKISSQPKTNSPELMDCPLLTFPTGSAMTVAKINPTFGMMQAD
jgi:hypothetical protein